MNLLALAGRVGEHVKRTLQRTDLREFGVTDPEPLEIAVLIFHDDGVEFQTAFQTTLDSEERLAHYLEHWLRTRQQQAPTQVM